MQIPESLLLKNDLDIQGILKQSALYLVSVETETHVFEEEDRLEQAARESSGPAGGMERWGRPQASGREAVCGWPAGSGIWRRSCSLLGESHARKNQSQESWKCMKEGKRTHPGNSRSKGLERGRSHRSMGTAFGGLHWSLAHFSSVARHKPKGSGCVSEYLSGICA